MGKLNLRQKPKKNAENVVEIVKALGALLTGLAALITALGALLK